MSSDNAPLADEYRIRTRDNYRPPHDMELVAVENHDGLILAWCPDGETTAQKVADALNWCSASYAEIERLRAENVALREIAQAVANLPIQDTWHGNTIELYDCEYFHVFDEDAHALVDRARALLEGARG